MRGPKVREWEQRLKGVFDEIDLALEREFSDRFRLHPARPPCCSTSNPEMDGLFNVGASFSLGLGSAHGAGYVVEIRLSTLDPIPAGLEPALRRRVKAMLTDRLPKAFPGRTLRIDEEKGGVLKICGDLSLD